MESPLKMGGVSHVDLLENDAVFVDPERDFLPTSVHMQGHLFTAEYLSLNHIRDILALLLIPNNLVKPGRQRHNLVELLEPLKAIICLSYLITSHPVRVLL